MAEAAALYSEGMPINKVAQLVGYHRAQMGRYLKLWDLYGPSAFITQKTVAAYPPSK